MGDVMQTDNSIPASEGDDEPLMTRDQLRLFLIEKGFPDRLFNARKALHALAGSRPSG